MPNKTIYVSDQDLPLFERAQSQAGGNLSSAIAQALRDFVDTVELRKQGYRSVEVEVGNVTFARKRFTGRLIATAYAVEDKRRKKCVVTILGGRNGREFEGVRMADLSQSGAEAVEAANEKYEVYQTIKGNLALHVEIMPQRNGSNPHEKRLEVYTDADELKGHVPDDLYQFVVQTLDGNGVEVLDI